MGWTGNEKNRPKGPGWYRRSVFAGNLFFGKEKRRRAFQGPPHSAPPGGNSNYIPHWPGHWLRVPVERTVNRVGRTENCERALRGCSQLGLSLVCGVVAMVAKDGGRVRGGVGWGVDDWMGGWKDAVLAVGVGPSEGAHSDAAAPPAGAWR